MPDQIISASNDYNLSLSEYLYKQRGIVLPSSLIPFYVEMVDQAGEPVVIKRDDDTTIKGIKLYINPATISFNMSKIIGRTQTMTGWFEEHWGEELDAISLQGSTAAFVIGPSGLPRKPDDIPLTGARIADVTAQKLYKEEATVISADAALRQSFNDFVGVKDPGSNTSSVFDSGLTTRNRQLSLGYQQFKQVIKIMENNGCVFDGLGFVRDRKQIQISYDYACYRGYIESIDTVEDSASPFKFTYTMVFKSERTMYTLMK